MEKGTSTDELLRFVDELSDEPAAAEAAVATSVASAALSTSSAAAAAAKFEVGDGVEPSSEVAAVITDIWADISDALDSWMKCIIVAESRHNNINISIDQRIEQSIHRMLEDGLLDVCDAHELRFIGDSWLRLLNAYSCYSIGCITYKRDIVSALLDLFSAKQISRDLFINICEQL